MIMRLLATLFIVLAVSASLTSGDEACTGTGAPVDNVCINCTSTYSFSIADGAACGECAYPAAGVASCTLVDQETGAASQSSTPYTASGNLSCGTEKRVRIPCPGGTSPDAVVGFVCGTCE